MENVKKQLHIVVDRNTPFVVDAFAHLARVTALRTLEITNDAVRDADVLIVRSETKVDRSLLDRSRVRFVGTVTIGIDHVDVEYLREQNIGFACAPGSNANSVAEYMAAALLKLAEHTGNSLKGKTLGVVGVGNVGSKVVRVAETLGMQVLQNDPPLARSTGEKRFVQLDELMDADFVTLHVPLTKTGPDATYHFFDETQIGKMKRGSVLINTARGAVVDTTALKQALEGGRLSAAIVDVWENEPAIDVELLSWVLLGTAHIAGYSLDGKVNALRMVYKAVCERFRLQDGWSVDHQLPEIQGKRIAWEDVHVSGEDLLRRVIRQVYDIELDDRLLRGLSSIANEKRADCFRQLRAEYRIRREFFNTEVELPGGFEHEAKTLASLGFKVKRQEK
jgi:erythronate-4-phosphate dehydrogenase